MMIKARVGLEEDTANHLARLERAMEGLSHHEHAQIPYPDIYGLPPHP